jgi:hypothetical protein
VVDNQRSGSEIFFCNHKQSDYDGSRGRSPHLGHTACESCSKLGCQVFQCLRDDHGIGQNRHEIGVAEPAWDDVDVEVLENSRASNFAEVDADVEAVGFHELGEGVLATASEFHQIGHLFVGEAIHVTDLFVGNDHQVAASVGVSVEQSVTSAVASDDKVGFVIVGLGDLGEQAFGGGGFWGENVFDSPWGVE